MTRIVTFNKGELVATYEEWPGDVYVLPDMDTYWHTGDWYSYKGKALSGRYLAPSEVPANLRAIVLLLT